MRRAPHSETQTRHYTSLRVPPKHRCACHDHWIKVLSWRCAMTPCTVQAAPEPDAFLSVTPTRRCAGKQILGTAHLPVAALRLLARDLVVEAAERDAKGLQAAQRPLVVHGERILAYAAELHHDQVRCEKHRGHPRAVSLSMGRGTWSRSTDMEVGARRSGGTHDLWPRCTAENF